MLAAIVAKKKKSRRQGSVSVFQKLAGKPKFEVRGAMREGLMGVMRKA
jgi:hypothetical protein